MKFTRSILVTAVISLSVLALRVKGQDDPASKEEVFVPYKIDWEKGLVIASEKDGKVRWQVPAERLNLGKIAEYRPNLAFDDDGAFVRCEKGVAALDDKTGNVRWSIPEKCESVAIVGKLVMLGKGEFAREKPVLVARNAADGKEIFRTELPFNTVDWWSATIENDNGRFIANFDFTEEAVLLNQTGKILHTFDTQILLKKKVGDNQAFFSGDEIFAISPKDTEAWSLKFKHGMSFLVAGEWIELADKTVVVFAYGMISDSGVNVVRFDPATGKPLWEAFCEPLGVSHSKYSHKATVAIRGAAVHVESIGSYGKFVEDLDLETGKQLARR